MVTQPLRPHALDQRYLDERFKALEDRVAALELLRAPPITATEILQRGKR